AVYWSRRGKTLIVSTDPAHSLADIFETEIGGNETRIAEHLFALEIDAQKSLAEYKRKLLAQYRQTVQEFEINLDAYLETIEHNPGAFESAIFDEFAKHLLRTDYDTIIFDTAPTGTTLRLIFMPEYLDSWIKFLIQSRKGILKLRDMLVREKDPVIETLYKMQKQFQQIAAVLKSDKTGIYLVLNPETLAFAETARTMKTLAFYHLPVNALIVNRVVDEKFPYQGYLKSQQKILDKIQDKFPEMTRVNVPFLGEEVKGLTRLNELTRYVEKLFS
ncbi:MAG: ArsA family ATPase, partial [Calditrichaeota bacterium]|nr:ArsA family ATPase [Calditrichota bacterium]